METLGVSVTSGNGPGPEVEAASIWFARQEVKVLLPHQEVLFERGIPEQLTADLSVSEIRRVNVHLV